MDVDVSNLRQQLPDYLARVRQGEHVRVISRGRVVAELMPPAPAPDKAAAVRQRLKGSALRHDDPTGPVLAHQEWQMHRE
ncbi:MAG: type II toxin-antitoxin system prevent-host-death family antitoxin [Methylibium sp.]|uniref:type II toxin-antitoxin system Phd/YefM family antitoxin n=1 Tax=Methylibium sp. TaxID=2067992 RepID=UPI0017B47B94|nr:type II toxin-antitoxin system prevent-host-death family antitoxin [Methylibium sp.]MBA3595868.1 type II toxin-antitoxin system prevent-host-death family antitoxin [Methylibium sp.]